MAEKVRCGWPGKDENMVKYHDEVWGKPIHDDRTLFEFLILEGAQAGLSWSTILNRKYTYKKAFDNFDAKKISKYTSKDKKRLLNDVGIIRNRLKVDSAILNAQKFLEVQKEFGSFDKYIWSFVNHKSIINKFKKHTDIPATTKESDAMSLDLKKRGFKFVGSTICYAFMEAVGMVNDHEVGCFRHK
jgi:DNA-3-methyladenine glycosylase I|tara:strand:+ start:834 stop:1394 length:561 start_codon:yes stop_codon:yes gene_type:complete